MKYGKEKMRKKESYFILITIIISKYIPTDMYTYQHTEGIINKSILKYLTVIYNNDYLSRFLESLSLGKTSI